MSRGGRKSLRLVHPKTLRQNRRGRGVEHILVEARCATIASLEHRDPNSGEESRLQNPDRRHQKGMVNPEVMGTRDLSVKFDRSSHSAHLADYSLV
jgi:hypothetical protein